MNSPADAMSDDAASRSSAAPGASSAAQSSRTAEATHATVSSLGDQPSAEDTLGFRVYVEALANFLLAPNTRPPLTISIEGPWGSGKSSFMLQLKGALRARSWDTITVDFNAWKYDQQEEMWAAFALGVARSLRKQASFLRRMLGGVRLYGYRVKGPRQAVALLGKLLAWAALVVAFLAACHWASEKRIEDRKAVVRAVLTTGSADTSKSDAGEAPFGSTPMGRSVAGWVYAAIAKSYWVTGALLALAIIWKIPDRARKNLLELKLEEYIDRPDYRGRAAFLDTFTDDFCKTVRAYAPRNCRIFVFIDDLDRCEPPKAADLMQAINLMIGDGGSLIFILGLDRAKVASAIAFKFREMVSYLGPRDADQEGGVSGVPNAARAFGDEFLEKFIQLSFRIPMPNDKELARAYIETLIGGSVSPIVTTPAVARWIEKVLDRGVHLSAEAAVLD
jgi:hypothetical protein